MKKKHFIIAFLAITVLAGSIDYNNHKYLINSLSLNYSAARKFAHVLDAHDISYKSNGRR